MSKKQGKKRASGAKSRGTVAILVLLLVSSAGLRIATSATEVLAEVNATLSADELEERLAADPEMPSDEDIARLLNAFANREEEIAKKEMALDRREIALDLAHEKVTERIKDLEAAEEKLRGTLALASNAAEDDLARLTTVYETMKPKLAAALFEEMDPEFAAGFIGRMRPDVSAAILAGMLPETAYAISTIIAGRNARVPKE